MTIFPLAVLLTGMVLAQSAVPDLQASLIVLGVSDVTRSASFYHETLGLAAAPAPGDLPMFRAGNLTIVLNKALAGGVGAFEIVFPVDSVSAMRKQLAGRGCAFIGETHEVTKDKWAATFTDPDGHRLTLFGAR